MEPQKKGEEGISPTIGVILMVAITVVIAAVVGTTVLGIGSGTSDTPQADFNARYDPVEGEDHAEITLTHKAGDKFKVSDIEIEVVTPNAEGRVVDLPCDCTSESDVANSTTGTKELFENFVWRGLLNAASDTDGTWNPGDRATVPINVEPASGDSNANPFGGDGIKKEDKIKITVYDKDTDSIVGSKEISPTEFLR